MEKKLKKVNIKYDKLTSEKMPVEELRLIVRQLIAKGYKLTPGLKEFGNGNSNTKFVSLFIENIFNSGSLELWGLEDRRISYGKVVPIEEFFSIIGFDYCKAKYTIYGKEINT